MILYWLTLAVVAAIVVILVVYLVAIALALNNARKNVAALADGLEAVAGHTEPLAEKVQAVDQALTGARIGFEAVDRELSRAAEAFEETPARRKS